MQHLRLAIIALICLTAASTTHAQIPSITQSNGHYALLVDGKPYFMLGGQCHNSSAWPSTLPNVWAAIESIHANTLEAPIYWEQIEPQPGTFDFSLIDTLLSQARTHQTRLVLLWFATWKNGSNHYMPAWMKADSHKYPNITARDGRPIDSPAPDANATLTADKKAFAAVMRHLKAADPQHTVIMVQVENEPGAWDTVRDFSPAAQKSFEGPVPPELLQPAVLSALHLTPGLKGSWQQVFGKRADEYFHAWNVAHFIGQVAAAGKAEYPLPLYCNAALRDPLTDPEATSYESGGPTDNVIPIWKTAAPAIDLLAPDIYLDGSQKVGKVIDLYNRPNNPLFVPEAGLTTENMKYLYAVIGNGGIGFSPFGIDGHPQKTVPPFGIDGHPQKTVPPFGTDGHPQKTVSPFGIDGHPESPLALLAHDYAILSSMSPNLAQWIAEGHTYSAIEPDDHAPQNIDLGNWQATLSFGNGRGFPLKGNTPPTGKALIIKLDDNKFLFTGTNCRITFKPKNTNAGRPWQYLKVEEGGWNNNHFEPLRILNGDETDWGGPLQDNEPTLMQITLQIR